MSEQKISELAKEIAELREEIKAYRKVLREFKKHGYLEARDVLEMFPKPGQR